MDDYGTKPIQLQTYITCLKHLSRQLFVLYVILCINYILSLSIMNKVLYDDVYSCILSGVMIKMMTMMKQTTGKLKASIVKAKKSFKKILKHWPQLKIQQVQMICKWNAKKITQQSSPQQQRTFTVGLQMCSSSKSNLAADIKIPEAFRFWCQLKMLWISWQDQVQNVDISLRTRLSSISDLICKCRSSVFCHVARLPPYQALKLQVKPLSQQISQCRLAEPSWSSTRVVGRPTASG